MWGQAKSLSAYLQAFRIIPTRVGTRYASAFAINSFQDHPHACGDKRIVLACAMWCGGSSPRVWGQARLRQSVKLLSRIIPTRVGTRLISQAQNTTYWDHPHACGDKKRGKNIILYDWGSSPRVWGQDESFKLPVEKLRIIPTRVGTRHTT